MGARTISRRGGVIIAALSGLAAIAASNVWPVHASTPELTTTADLADFQDTVNVLSNPYTGWTLYRSEGSHQALSNPAFWNRAGDGSYVASDADAEKALDELKPSSFYVRASWRELEPSDGQYAWNDPNSRLYQDIQGAMARGLQIAWRVYVTDYKGPGKGTPDWLYKNEGSVPDHCVDLSGTTPAVFVDSENKRCNKDVLSASIIGNPDYGDAAFKREFGEFLTAFAAHLNTAPGKVAYMDAQSFGFLGENNDLANMQIGPKYRDMSEDQKEVAYDAMYEWQNTAFQNAFASAKYPLTVIKGNMPRDQYDALIATGKYMPRMDHSGSAKWGSSDEIKDFTDKTQKIPSVAEDTWQKDAEKANYLGGILSDAVSNRANMLNLRQYAKWQVNGSNDKWWALNGGYRISPMSVVHPDSITKGSSFQISSTWVNQGTGIFPGHLTQLRGKYRLAFALLDPQTHAHKATSVDMSTNPGDWVDGEKNSVSTSVTFSDSSVESGRSYKLAVGLVNTWSGNSPQIKLALTKPSYTPEGKTPAALDARWYEIGTVSVS
jgi:hypothetical protein